MIRPEIIQVTLLSDTSFSRGEGTAGVVDAEVEHDETGLPVLRGKTLRGLLKDAWLTMCGHFEELAQTSIRVFGESGGVAERGILRVEDAMLDSAIRQWADYAINRQADPLSVQEILGSLTDVRRQTAEERVTGAPAESTLRSIRTVIREVCFQAKLVWLVEPEPSDVRCLALSILAVRHGGLGRNRGPGHLCLSLDGDRGRTIELAKGGPCEP